MDPIENFNNKLLLAVALWTGHLARCADQAGILDADARKSIRHHFSDLSQGAVELDHPEMLAWIDTLARALPPLARD